MGSQASWCVASACAGFIVLSRSGYLSLAPHFHFHPVGYGHSIPQAARSYNPHSRFGSSHARFDDKCTPQLAYYSLAPYRFASPNFCSYPRACRSNRNNLYRRVQNVCRCRTTIEPEHVSSYPELANVACLVGSHQPRSIVTPQPC